MEIWGDKMKVKSSNNIRISFQNVNGFFTEDDMEYKPNQIRQFIQEKQIDAHLMAEMNVKWSIVQH